MRIARAVGTPMVLCCSLILSSFFANAAAHAATISYGNFGPVPPGVSFIDVKESSGTDPVPLYGPPTPFSVGLDFDPANYVATSAGGGADITDGQLNFTVMGISVATGSIGIGALSLFEAGDYTLAGAGGPPTSVTAGAITRATVTQINGLPVAPINLIPVNASFGDSLPGPVIVAPWSLGTTMDISAQLAGLGYGPDSVATKVEIAINNALVATSEPNSAAFIAKKEFQITIRPDPVGTIPEPSTAVLMGLVLGLVGLVAKRNRR